MDKKFVALMVVFFVVFGAFITGTLFNEQISNISRASTETDPSSSNSLIFYWPIQNVKVGDKVDINVFIRNVNKFPLEKKPVRLVTNLGLINGISQESTIESDKTGKANFTLTSDTPGEAQVTAFANGNIQLSQKITVKFE